VAKDYYPEDALAIPYAVPACRGEKKHHPSELGAEYSNQMQDLTCTCVGIANQVNLQSKTHSQYRGKDRATGRHSHQ
jgi:hypothetical protein